MLLNDAVPSLKQSNNSYKNACYLFSNFHSIHFGEDIYICIVRGKEYGHLQQKRQQQKHKMNQSHDNQMHNAHKLVCIAPIKHSRQLIQ